MTSRILASCTILLILTALKPTNWKPQKPTELPLIRTNSASNSIKHPTLNQTVNDFDLTDPSGNHFPFTQVRSDRLTVIAFLGTECPLAKLYGTRLETLSQEYRQDSVTFIGICSNAQDSQQDVKNFVARHHLTFPVFKDKQHQIADQLKAIRTPEVFLLNANQQVVYWGRIDDQYAIGIKKAKPKRSDLKIAIEESLSGKPVSVPIAESVGCHIGRLDLADVITDVTFHEHIAPLLKKHCVSCHSNQNIAPFALFDYHEVVGWAPMIREVVEQQRMPPWFANPKHGTCL